MSSIILILYVLVILVAVAMAAAIIFHLLHYKINRRVASVMFVIYLIGTIFLLLSNLILFNRINWYQIISNFGF